MDFNCSLEEITDHTLKNKYSNRKINNDSTEIYFKTFKIQFNFKYWHSDSYILFF